MALGISQFYIEAVLLVDIASTYGNIEYGFAIFNLGCAEDCLPRVDVAIACKYQFYRTIEACARIPTRALFKVLQIYLQLVLARLHIGRDIHAEGIISVCPIAYFLAIQIDCWLGHSAVKQQFGVHPFAQYVDGAFIMSLTNPRQSAAAATLLGSFCLAVLFDGHILQIPFLIEWSGYRPIVRHANLFPYFFIVRKAPVITQSYLLSGLCQHR